MKDTTKFTIKLVGGITLAVVVIVGLLTGLHWWNLREYDAECALRCQGKPYTLTRGYTVDTFPLRKWQCFCSKPEYTKHW